ncbi:MAG: BMP family ABC transporter substrate-binding protein, partial [Anaerolineae bacterium]|nr:BMP family ABC transporter substrate-binding protein [Anaerolineae bacterium]
NPQAIILSEYIGGEGDYSGFAKPELGMELTTAMYQQGADIVYAAAGGSVLGAIEAAKNENQLIITTGSDQRWIAPGVVVTSRTKNMDIAVYDLIVQLLAGDLKTELIQFDYRSNGVGFAPLSKELVPDDVMKEFETVKNDLSTGKINIELECQP